MVGAKRSGSSSDALVMSMVAGSAACSYVSPLPQRPQNLRVTPGDDPNCTGAPDSHAKAERLTVNHATAGAPLARRQLVQWHIAELAGVAAMR